MFTILRTRLIGVLLLAFILARLVAISNLRGDDTITARMVQYANLTARTVCYPTTYADDLEGYATTSYAVIPAVLVEAGEVCDENLP